MRRTGFLHRRVSENASRLLGSSLTRDVGSAVASPSGAGGLSGSAASRKELVYPHRRTDLQAARAAALSGAAGGRVAPPRHGGPFSKQGRHQHPNVVRVSESELRASRRYGHARRERSRNVRAGPHERWSGHQRASSIVSSQRSPNVATDGGLAGRRGWGLRTWLDDDGQEHHWP